MKVLCAAITTGTFFYSRGYSRTGTVTLSYSRTGTVTLGQAYIFDNHMKDR